MEKNSLFFFSSKIAQILLVIQINIMKNLQVSADGHSRKKKTTCKTNQPKKSIYNHSKIFQKKTALRKTFLQKMFL